MSDAGLRRLEREWRGTGSREAECAWLGARFKAGDLPESRLELAAYLGHRAAIDLCGEVPSDPRFTQWFHQIGRWGRPEIIRALLPAIYLEPGAVVVEENRGVVEAVEDWVLCPCSGCVATAEGVFQSLEDPFRHDPPGVSRGFEVTRGQYAVARSLLAVLEARAFKNRALEALGCILDCLTEARISSLTQSNKQKQREGHRARARGQVEATACVAVRDELVPWALGYSDPVRERVEARQREGCS